MGKSFANAKWNIFFYSFIYRIIEILIVSRVKKLNNTLLV